MHVPQHQQRRQAQTACRGWKVANFARKSRVMQQEWVDTALWLDPPPKPPKGSLDPRPPPPPPEILPRLTPRPRR